MSSVLAPCCCPIQFRPHLQKMVYTPDWLRKGLHGWLQQRLSALTLSLPLDWVGLFMRKDFVVCRKALEREEKFCGRKKNPWLAAIAWRPSLPWDRNRENVTSFWHEWFRNVVRQLQGFPDWIVFVWTLSLACCARTFLRIPFVWLSKPLSICNLALAFKKRNKESNYSMQQALIAIFVSSDIYSVIDCPKSFRVSCLLIAAPLNCDKGRWTYSQQLFPEDSNLKPEKLCSIHEFMLRRRHNR